MGSPRLFATAAASKYRMRLELNLKSTPQKYPSIGTAAHFFDSFAASMYRMRLELNLKSTLLKFAELLYRQATTPGSLREAEVTCILQVPLLVINKQHLIMVPLLLFHERFDKGRF